MLFRTHQITVSSFNSNPVISSYRAMSGDPLLLVPQLLGNGWSYSQTTNKIDDMQGSTSCGVFRHSQEWSWCEHINILKIHRGPRCNMMKNYCASEIGIHTTRISWKAIVWNLIWMHTAVDKSSSFSNFFDFCQLMNGKKRRPNAWTIGVHG